MRNQYCNIKNYRFLTCWEDFMNKLVDDLELLNSEWAKVWKEKQITLFVEIHNDIRHIVSVETHFCVPCSLYTNKWSIHESWEDSEYFSLPTSRTTAHQNVAGSNCFSQFIICNSLSGEFVSDSVSNRLFRLSLRYNMLVKFLAQLRWCHVPAIFINLLQYFICIYFWNSRETESLLKFAFFS